MVLMRFYRELMRFDGIKWDLSILYSSDTWVVTRGEWTLPPIKLKIWVWVKI